MPAARATQAVPSAPSLPLLRSQDAPISTKAFDEPPFMLGGMTDLQCAPPPAAHPRARHNLTPHGPRRGRHESMRDHVARMTGGGTPGSAWDGR